MKEKRIDIYLAEAAIYHLVLIGFGGTFLNEVVQEAPRLNVSIFSGALGIISLGMVRNRILKARSVAKKLKKHRDHE